jgi:uncharacterized protein YegP (UPF0339 family)
MSGDPRFEVIHADAGWFARFVGANGRKVWQTEVYGRRVAAFRAIELIVGNPVRAYGDEFEVSVGFGVTGRGLLEVRMADERSAS